jgi:hypothetical protein
MEGRKEPTDTVLFFPQGFNEAVGSIEQKSQPERVTAFKWKFNTKNGYI